MTAALEPTGNRVELEEVSARCRRVCQASGIPLKEEDGHALQVSWSTADERKAGLTPETIAATSAGHQPTLRRVPVVALQPDIGGLARFFLPRLDVIGDPFLDLVQGHCVGRVGSSSATAGHNFESLPAALSKLEAQALERARNPVLLSAHRRFLISCLVSSHSSARPAVAPSSVKIAQSAAT